MIRLAAGIAAAAVLVAALNAILAPDPHEAAPAAVVGERSFNADDSSSETGSAPGHKLGKRRSSASPAAQVEQAPKPLITFIDRQAGFRIRLPATWRSRTAESGGAPPAIVFQIPTPSGSAGRFAMSVSIGTRDGRITLCTPKCAAVRALSVDELAQYLVPARGSYSRDAVRDIELGGEQGRLEVPKSIALPHYCLPEFVYDAYAIHQDRPVVLRISYCVTRPGGTPEPGLPSDLVTRMLESFEFLD
jgi:hypothetical protein